jgi:hypothetical protein
MLNFKIGNFGVKKYNISEKKRSCGNSALWPSIETLSVFLLVRNLNSCGTGDSGPM